MIALLGVGGSRIMERKWERWKLGGSGGPWWEGIDCLRISTWDFASGGRGERNNERTIHVWFDLFTRSTRSRVVGVLTDLKEIPNSTTLILISIVSTFFYASPFK